ncbi:MAG TPA: N-acetylmuramoyl-L-alanine amidase [Aquabacterium sp.]|uniref:N-acetylmuramoyl-L-alanine amidase n=1 Tax=Aquabacterium sp. TaxID=1872578 RepID=UPI002E336C5D|nr:N-acetylmuramoyl-L-alanine amidase [Aquabacterium sp.]HEX5372522.1 N-acetylmuramoyl-L-alanine amidase [Aquabacterium sp.]
MTSSLRIDDKHRLVGDQVTFRATPNHGGVLKPRYLVMHYTAGRSAASSVESLCTQKPSGNASAHVVLGRDGSIVQLAPFNVVTWHAGVSQWNGLIGLNNHSIGIEMDNAGQLKKVGSQYQAWFGKVYPDDEVLLAEHKHGGGIQPWHTYTEVQIERALELAELLVARYGLEDVLGHEDIARGRKADPGPAFPLASVQSRALGRTQDEPAHFVVTATSLNIRSAPDAAATPVAAPLKKGTELILLEPLDRWSRVEVIGKTDLEGWVSNSYIQEIQPASQRSTPAAKKAAARRR